MAAEFPPLLFSLFLYCRIVGVCVCFIGRYREWTLYLNAISFPEEKKRIHHPSMDSLLCKHWLNFTVIKELTFLSSGRWWFFVRLLIRNAFDPPSWTHHYFHRRQFTELFINTLAHRTLNQYNKQQTATVLRMINIKWNGLKCVGQRVYRWHVRGFGIIYFTSGWRKRWIEIRRRRRRCWRQRTFFLFDEFSLWNDIKAQNTVQYISIYTTCESEREKINIRITCYQYNRQPAFTFLFSSLFRFRGDHCCMSVSVHFGNHSIYKNIIVNVNVRPLYHVWCAEQFSVMKSDISCESIYHASASFSLSHRFSSGSFSYPFSPHSHTYTHQ